MSAKKWILLTLFSLVLVAILGVLLRYKITFSLPFINQKYLQHSHSHFALSGWLTQILMILLASSVSAIKGKEYFQKYNLILFLNLIASYGMLISFLLHGYGAISVLFSCLSIIAIYYFGIRLWKDIKGAPLHKISFIWFKAAIVFAVLSSFGVTMLVYLMATHNVNISVQQATTYFYLHFQYNGWLTFACLGLLFDLLENKNIHIKKLREFFWFYAVACIPAYFLSALWLPLPMWIYIIVVISAIILLIGWVWLVLQIRERFTSTPFQIPVISKWLLGCSALAFTIKVILQAGSTIPSLNNMAFGYRPIVIGYLHLVFLGVITLFILGYLVYMSHLKVTKILTIGFILFVIGIILNELMLMTQGLAAMGYYSVPYINEILFGITILMLLGTIIINIGANKKSASTIERF